MRKASMVMGIIGGALALLFGLLYIFGSSLFFSVNSWGGDNFEAFSPQNASASIGGTVFLVIGICMLIGGVLGFIGGLIVRRKNVAGGVLMIVAAVLGINLFSLVLFVLGAVFALMRDRSQMYVPPYYAYPPYGTYPPQYMQPPYPPGQYPPQQQQPVPPQNPPENPQP